jgi:hypothetical protein
MESLRKHTKEISIVVGIAAAAAGLYFLVKKVVKDDGETTTTRKVDIVDETGTILSNSEREAIARAIRIERNGQNLSIVTISQICDATLRFAAPDFIRLTNTDRQERRALKNDLRKYIELWDTYAHQLEDIIEKSQKEVLRALNISDEDWENSNGFYMQSGNHELLMIHASLPQKLKMSLGVGDKSLDATKFKEVLRAQVDLLQREAENLDEIRQYVTREEEVAPIIQNRVNDKIFETYGVEEEHIYGSMRAHMMDPEVQQIFMQLQQATMRLVPMQGGPGGFF